MAAQKLRHLRQGRLKALEGVVAAEKVVIPDARRVAVTATASTGPPAGLLTATTRSPPHLFVLVWVVVEAVANRGVGCEGTDEGLHPHSPDGVEEVVHGRAAGTRRRFRRAPRAAEARVARRQDS